MKKNFLFLIAILIFAVGWPVTVKSSSFRIYDVKQGREISLSQALADLEEKRIILVGEYHTEKNHHLAQLRVIQMLHESSVHLAIGLEMFRKDSQDGLDRWISGELSEKDFQAVYYDNWNYSWPFYSMIFKYARDHGIKMVGLNIPRKLTRQVASHGFGSLNEKQKGTLSNITCRVDKEYMEYIRSAFGAHAHGDLNFTYFCEAQLVWDTVMAINALEYLNSDPDAVMVILAGSGHVRKPAIPQQIKKRSNLTYAVLLPEIPGRIDPNTVSDKETDYIIFAPVK
ncbi:MAG: ChaN family lipoprotein [Deltaproteobacteria bacterium]|nr:MAG: ChaN family lipoprotein [Deltaproteobacteria bacterium]